MVVSNNAALYVTAVVFRAIAPKKKIHMLIFSVLLKTEHQIVKAVK